MNETVLRKYFSTTYRDVMSLEKIKDFIKHEYDYRKQMNKLQAIYVICYYEIVIVT
jgi:hypothetical protein